MTSLHTNSLGNMAIGKHDTSKNYILKKELWNKYVKDTRLSAKGTVHANRIPPLVLTVFNTFKAVSISTRRIQLYFRNSCLRLHKYKISVLTPLDDT